MEERYIELYTALCFSFIEAVMPHGEYLKVKVTNNDPEYRDQAIEEIELFGGSCEFIPDDEYVIFKLI